VPREHLPEARYAIQFFLGVHRFRDAVAEEHQRVAGIQLEAKRSVFRFGHQSDGIRAFGEGFLGDAPANQKRRRVAGIDVFQVALLVEDSEKHRGVAPDLCVITQKAVDMIEDSCRVGAQGHPGERALQHGRKKGGAESFAGNVGDQKSGAIVAQRKDVEVVSPYGQARIIDAVDREMRILAEVAREQRLLNTAGDVQLLLHALTFALSRILAASAARASRI
jgi:hypothetical protein